MSRTQSWVLELCLLRNNEQLYKVRTSGWIIASQAFYATFNYQMKWLYWYWFKTSHISRQLILLPVLVRIFIMTCGTGLSRGDLCETMCVCVCVFFFFIILIFLMLLLLYHWACSVDMPNTVKNSKNYSQLMLRHASTLLAKWIILSSLLWLSRTVSQMRMYILFE